MSSSHRMGFIHSKGYEVVLGARLLHGKRPSIMSSMSNDPQVCASSMNVGDTITPYLEAFKELRMSKALRRNVK